MASSAVQWQVLRNNSCFIVKSRHGYFSTEPSNLTSRNSFKFSGLANEKSVGVAFNKETSTVEVSMKKKRFANKPAKNVQKVSLASRKGIRSIAKTLKGLTAGNHYRADLTQAAIAKAAAILKSTKRSTKAVQRPRRKILA